MSENTTTRNIDVVFVLDATGSMSPIMDSVKENARRFYSDFVNAVAEMGSEIGSLRTKIIAFRDYGCDSVPMDESMFFELPDDEDLFSNKLNSILPSGGGDLPENGLEALYLAMKSDFVTGDLDRQLIVLITDADALDLGERKGSERYPADMGDMGQLIAIWDGALQDPNIKLRNRNKRLVMFAPAGTKYEMLTSVLNGSIFQAVNPGHGLEGVDFTDIVKICAASVGR